MASLVKGVIKLIFPITFIISMLLIRTFSLQQVSTEKYKRAKISSISDSAAYVGQKLKTLDSLVNISVQERHKTDSSLNVLLSFIEKYKYDIQKAIDLKKEEPKLYTNGVVTSLVSAEGNLIYIHIKIDTLSPLKTIEVSKVNQFYPDDIYKIEKIDKVKIPLKELDIPKTDLLKRLNLIRKRREQLKRKEIKPNFLEKAFIRNPSKLDSLLYRRNQEKQKLLHELDSLEEVLLNLVK